MKNKFIIISVLLLCVLCMLSVVLVFSLLDNFASRKLLKVIASAQPGQHISKIKEEFGPRYFDRICLTEQTMFNGNFLKTQERLLNNETFRFNLAFLVVIVK